MSSWDEWQKEQDRKVERMKTWGPALRAADRIRKEHLAAEAEKSKKDKS